MNLKEGGNYSNIIHEKGKVWPVRNWSFKGLLAKFLIIQNNLVYWAESDATLPTVSSRTPRPSQTQIIDKFAICALLLLL